MTDAEIVAAEEAHLSEIVAIAAKLSLGSDREGACERGFLVSGLHESEYREYLTQAEHFRVALVDGAVGGFLLAYSNAAGEAGWLDRQVAARSRGPYGIIKQIAVDPGLAGRGIATALYRRLFAEASGLPLFAAVVLDPPNRRSIAFHERLGFTEEARLPHPDGMMRAIYMRRPEEQAPPVANE